MRNIRVVHDNVGTYSYWEYSTFHEGIQEPWLTRYWHGYFEGKRKPNYPVPAIRCEVAIDHHGTTVYVDSFQMCGDQTIWDIKADSRINHPRTSETI